MKATGGAGPIHGRSDRLHATIVVILVIGATVILEAIQHRALRGLSPIPFDVLAGVMQGGITLVVAAVYLRWRRRAEDARRALDQVRESERTRDELTAMLVHDLKNPVVSSTMALQAVLRRDKTKPHLSEEEVRFLQMARDSQARLIRMIEDMLTVARAEGDTVDIAHDAVDICGVADEAVSELQVVAREAEITLIEDCPASTTILGDRELLRRLLGNLIANALHFTPDGGRVEVRVGERDGAVVVEVKDTGSGIADDVKDHIFDKFFQGEPRERRSVGLGLTLCKIVAEAHGGSIRLDSTPGEGSTFVVTLPRQPDPGVGTPG